MKRLSFKFFTAFNSDENGRESEDSRKINGTANIDKCLFGRSGELSENKFGSKYAITKERIIPIVKEFLSANFAIEKVVGGAGVTFDERGFEDVAEIDVTLPPRIVRG